MVPFGGSRGLGGSRDLAGGSAISAIGFAFPAAPDLLWWWRSERERRRMNDTLCERR
jgi:hypothetical protein